MVASITNSEPTAFDNAGFIKYEKPPERAKSTPPLISVQLDPPNQSKYDPSEKWRMLKNVFIISFAFMLNFTAFQSMANLQSSLNSAAGLGTYSLSALYAALVISSMFVPTYLIRVLTVKWTLAVSMVTFSVYIAAQFYPRYTLIPGAIVLGIGAAPLWSAKCTYLTHLGGQYAQLTKDDVEVVIVRFFGVFFMFFQSASIWGNLISSTVLSNDVTPANVSNRDISKCGSNFCAYQQTLEIYNNESSVVSSATSKSSIYTLAGIYLGCSLAAVLVVSLLVDSLARYGENERAGSSSNLSGKQLAVATFYHMKKPYQLLIIPLTIWDGMEQGFLGAEFTQGFVTCSWGVQHVGYVLICYGVCDALFSVSCSFILRIIGRFPIFVFGAILNIIMIFVMLFWVPNDEQHYVFYIMAAVWGISDAIWQTQINAFYGVMFPSDEEAAFSNYRLWESVGFIIAYAYSYSLCVYVKLYILLGVISIGMTGYSVIEYCEYKRKRKIAK